MRAAAAAPCLYAQVAEIGREVSYVRGEACRIAGRHARNGDGCDETQDGQHDENLQQRESRLPRLRAYATPPHGGHRIRSLMPRTASITEAMMPATSAPSRMVSSGTRRASPR